MNSFLSRREICKFGLSTRIFSRKPLLLKIQKLQPLTIKNNNMLCTKLTTTREFAIYISQKRNIFKKTKTHYDILEIKKTASQKDIKQAFMKLSKLYHPDSSSKGRQCHATFMKINEAYRVLSKPQSKHLYDLHISPVIEQSRPQKTSESSSQFYETADYWHAFKKNTYASADDSYYGIKGLPKQSNAVVLVPFAIFLLGFVYFFAAYSFSKYRLRKEKEYLDEECDSHFNSISPQSRHDVENFFNKRE